MTATATATKITDIIDASVAQMLLADLEDGKSLGSASMMITTQYYKREDFAAFREANGDIATVIAITRLALS